MICPTVYVPPHGNKKPGQPQTPDLQYIECAMGDSEAWMLQQSQIVALVQDQSSLRKFVVACSVADHY